MPRPSQSFSDPCRRVAAAKQQCRIGASHRQLTPMGECRRNTVATAVGFSRGGAVDRGDGAVSGRRAMSSSAWTDNAPIGSRWLPPRPGRSSRPGDVPTPCACGSGRLAFTRHRSPESRELSARTKPRFYRRSGIAGVDLAALTRLPGGRLRLPDAPRRSSDVRSLVERLSDSWPK